MRHAAIAPTDPRSEGIAAVMLDATQHHAMQLTPERLFRWHGHLFPGKHDIAVGDWRPGPVVFTATATRTNHRRPSISRRGAACLRRNGTILRWFNGTPGGDGIIRSGLAHLYFVTIHPFEDGNGRIARAIADVALAQDERSTRRFFSMPRQIREERAQYYNALRKPSAVHSTVTLWLGWFLQCYERAVQSAMHMSRRYCVQTRLGAP